MKLDEAAFAEILEIIESGAWVETACKASGVRRENLWRYCRKDPKRRARLNEAQRKRDAVMEEAALAQLTQFFKTDWRACAWFLQHTAPEKYSIPYRIARESKDRETSTQETRIHIEVRKEDLPAIARRTEILQRIERRKPRRGALIEAEPADELDSEGEDEPETLERPRLAP